MTEIMSNNKNEEHKDVAPYINNVCINCKHDLLEDKNSNFLCERGVTNDENGDFISNPLKFSCCYYQQKNQIENIKIEVI